jgi:hypothetical protein
VVLGDMQAIKAGFVGGGGKFNPLVEKLCLMVLSAHAREGGHRAPPPSRGRADALAPQSSLFAIFRRA